MARPAGKPAFLNSICASRPGTILAETGNTGLYGGVVAAGEDAGGRGRKGTDSSTVARQRGQTGQHLGVPHPHLCKDLLVILIQRQPASCSDTLLARDIYVAFAHHTDSIPS